MKESVTQTLSLSFLMFIMLLVFGCGSDSLIKKEDRFKYHACLTVYCEESESSLVKKAGLKLIEITATSAGVDLSLDNGVCEEYYRNRHVSSGYVYLNKSALEICKEQTKE